MANTRLYLTLTSRNSILINPILFLINPCKCFCLEEPNITKKTKQNKQTKKNGYIDRETSRPDQKLFSLLDTLQSQPVLESSRKKITGIS